MYVCSSENDASADGSIPTSVSFSNELDAFGRCDIARAEVRRFRTEKTPEAIRFRVAVSKLGEIRYCFPMNSSGDPALDEQARLVSDALPFLSKRPADAGKPDASLAWGIATIEWGNDIARPQADSQAAATPVIRVSLAALVTIYLLLFLRRFSLLDSGRMESPAAGATGSAVSAALRDLRVRI